VFISYRRLDAQRVRPLVDRLRHLGIELTAACLAPQQAGDPCQRVLIVNTSPDHIALPELKDQQYLLLAGAL
jgi:hypothetical protein